MAVLINTLQATSGSDYVSLDSALGTAGDIAQTLTIESEEMRVLRGGGSTGLWVERGVNGTTVAAHAIGTTVTLSDTLTPSQAELDLLDTATAGTVVASKAVVVGAQKQVNEWTVTSGVLTQTQTTASTTPGTIRGVYGKVTGSATGTTSGLLTGARGEVTFTGTITGGVSIYGGQGKLIFSGTMNHEDSRLTALMAQLDISAGTYTAGQISALWVDAGATSVSGALGGQFNMVRITNTTESVPNAVIYAYSEGSFLLDLDGPGGNADWFEATASGGATRSHRLKVKIGGTTAYISAFTD